MPEGHTIARLSRDHKAWFANRRMRVLSPQGRFADEASRLDGATLHDVSAHGKHLFYHWGRNGFVHIHLGLYGRFRLHEPPFPEPRGAVRLRMMASRYALDLNGPTCCELVNKDQCLAIKDRLGEDPLDPGASAETVWERISTSRAPIGTLLLDQSVIAGIGNIYRAEILFLLKIHPSVRGNELSEKQFIALWRLTIRLMELGVEHNRIITTDSSRGSKSTEANARRGKQVNIYKSDHCPRCRSAIRCWNLASRKMYACETCQTQA